MSKKSFNETDMSLKKSPDNLGSLMRLNMLYNGDDAKSNNKNLIREKFKQTRLDMSGIMYHIMVRSIKRRQIFTGNAEWDEILRRLSPFTEVGKLNDCGYSPKPNHYHL